MHPDTLQYQLVYDVAAAGYTDWGFPLYGVFMGGAALWLFRRKARNNPEKAPTRRHQTFVMFLIGVWTLIAFFGPYEQYATLSDALRAGHYEIVEGTVQNFGTNTTARGNDSEFWDVESGGEMHTYNYSTNFLTPGFRRTHAHGGPITEGVRVRIADVSGHIARLEIAR